MPNWDHVCPRCGERGSYLDFGTTETGDTGTCPDPECAYTAPAEEFMDPTYY